jgi:hypothetical protein
MSTKEKAYALLQTIYYDSIDRGDMVAAASALHESVEWSHLQVWAHHNFTREKGPEQLKGRQEVEAFLSARKGEIAELKVRHKIRDLVFESDKGAFLGYVGREGKEVPFIGWYELNDDKVSRYIIRPL